MNKTYIAATLILLFSFASPALAHVVVKPDSVGIGAFQTFTVSTPSERDESTVNIRLVLPEGLENVSPTVKPGWDIEVITDNSEAEKPLEIRWAGGNIPGHFRDDLTFSARVPAEPTTLIWKAYQTYSDGSIVSWELSPNDEQPQKEEGGPDFSVFGPASQTQIIDDLSSVVNEVAEEEETPDITFALSIGALIIALASFAVSVRKNKS